MRAPVRLLPGLAFMAGVAAASRVVGGSIPGVSPLVLAIAAGVAVGNLVGVPAVLEPGLDRHKLLLEVGIVLLGARLAVDSLLSVGPALLLLTVGVVAFGVVHVEALSRVVFGVDDRTTSLLAAGSSVCGVSAVVAVAGGIDADEASVAYATGTVLLFDAVTLVAVPAAGRLLGLPARAFGIWAGLSMFSTGPVVAAGLSYAPTAGEWATLTKVARNSLIGLLVLAYSARYARDGGGTARDRLATLWTRFPKFVVGFVLVAVVANAGLVSEGGRAALDAASGWLFATAFVGLGVEIRASEMRGTGLTPVALVAVHTLVAAGLALAAVLLLT
jgi:uncharacterized integral membrane protein (TIGR00698 family)